MKNIQKFRAWDKVEKRMRCFGDIPIEVNRSSTMWLDEILKKAHKGKGSKESKKD